MLKYLLSPRVLAPMVAGLLIGALVGPFQLSCGVVENRACAADQCPPGPEGPPGPAGPRGPGFADCQWLYTACQPGPGIECQQVCLAGTFPVSGSCDAQGGATLSENRASTGAAVFPDSPVAFTGFDRWVCETATGNMQFTYALCCKP
ncbi:MAG TPA: hypothetical protein VK607_02310 [Kofleriaceae bacterium]|nr:hypothetical protein [Kofleriaceae bacterium]